MYLLSSVVFVKGFVSFVVLQVIRLQRFLLDSAESFTKFAHKVVLLEVGGDVVLPQQNVHLLHLLVGHAQGADTTHGQLPLAQPAVGVELDQGVVLGADGKGCLHTGPANLLPVEPHLLTHFLLEPYQPLLGDLTGHLPVTGPHYAFLDLVFLHRLLALKINPI